MSFSVIYQDITKMKVDAIVNAANSHLIMGGGVCGAIYRAAGIESLSAYTHQLQSINTGEAIVSPAFNLSAKMIIHAVGPIYINGQHQEAQLLKQAYLNSLKLAVEHQCTSIAFPLISSGIYGYPKCEAFRIAKNTILEFLSKHTLTVYLVLYDKESFNLFKEELDSDDECL